MLNAFTQMVEREDSEQTFIVTKSEDVRKNFHMTNFGYWILPDGTLVSLLKSMSHGQVALKLEPKIDAIHDATAVDEDDLLDPVAAQLIAVSELHWVRVALGWDLTVDWGSKVTNKQIRTLETVIDDHGAEDNPSIWFVGGPGDKATLMKKLHEVERHSHA